MKVWILNGLVKFRITYLGSNILVLQTHYARIISTYQFVYSHFYFKYNPHRLYIQYLCVYACHTYETEHGRWNNNFSFIIQYLWVFARYSSKDPHTQKQSLKKMKKALCVCWILFRKFSHIFIFCHDWSLKTENYSRPF